MAEFLYYIPGARGEALDERRRLGLDATLGRSANCRELDPGPDGGPGLLLTRGYADYQPANQSWTPVAGVWLGVWAADHPRPEDLLRPEMVLRPGGPVGRPLRLLDGREWLVPVVYPTTSDEYALPRVLRLRPTEPPEQYAEVPEEWRPLVEGTELLVRAARAALEALPSSPSIPSTKSTLEVSIPDTLDLGALALSVNYRVGAREVAVLGLLDTRSLGELAKVLIDWPLTASASDPEIQTPEAP